MRTQNILPLQEKFDKKETKTTWTITTCTDSTYVFTFELYKMTLYILSFGDLPFLKVCLLSMLSGLLQRNH